ncbi:MAG TPA: hypothetical protein VF119_09820, partial [Candidatus Limnocylindrales bacterium]
GLVGLMVSSAPSVLQGQAFLGGSAASGPAGDAPPAIEAAPAPGGGMTDIAGQTDAAAPVAPGDPGDTSIVGSSDPARAGASPAPVFGTTNAGPIPSRSGGAGNADGSDKGSANGAVEPSPQDSDTTAEMTATAPASGVNLLPIVSVGLLIVGLGLFVLRWGARRFGA